MSAREKIDPDRAAEAVRRLKASKTWAALKAAKSRRRWKNGGGGEGPRPQGEAGGGLNVRA